MALSFTDIADRHGPAVYIIGSGDARSERIISELGNEVDKLTNGKTQVVCLGARSGDGLRVKEFYGLAYFPCVLIILDDDTIVHQWDCTLPRAKDIVYTLHHISGGVRGS